MQNQLRQLCRRLLEEGDVQVVIGYGQADADGPAHPVFITMPENAGQLVWNDRCHANLTTYLTRKEIQSLGKPAIVVKSCDERALVVLEKESQIHRAEIIVIGMACGGMRKYSPLPKGEETLPKCLSCDTPVPRRADHLIADDSVRPAAVKPRYSDIEEFLKKSPEDRMAYWREELGRCEKCYACRQACPLCYCRRCIVEKNFPQCISTSATPKGNFAYHIARAFHQAGRCVGCDECARICPAGIDLRLLNLVLAKAAEEKFSYRSGVDPDAEPIIGRYSENDKEDFHPMSEIITRASLMQLAEAWLGNGRSVVGPVRTSSVHVFYRSLSTAGELILEGFVRPRNSIKEFFLPRHEELYGYRIRGKQIELVEAANRNEERLILGARPCDAAALPILDRVFNWDYRDEFYNRRRESTTVVALACRESDANCFCTSLGLSPDAAAGADAVLFDLGGGEYEVRTVTEKGFSLFAGKTQSSEKSGNAATIPDRSIDWRKIEKYLASEFENPAWKTMTLRCLGCGACAYNCPACHCFDIADEGSPGGGARVRNWDSCQFGLYSLHASGHNPRDVQAKRQRQRIYHKFKTYPEKFGDALCTGCGNCTRSCPVALGVRPILDTIGREP